MNKKEFWFKFVLWIVFVAVVPIIAIIDKYDMIKNKPLKYTGWGIIVISIIAITLLVILGYVLKLMKWSMWKQIVSGIRNVLVPIGVLFVLSGLIANNIENIKYILVVSFISEAIAIPINPFPKWIYEKNISDLREALK